MNKHIMAVTITFCLWPLQATARTNFLEIFAKSNEPQCVELQLEGFALFARLSLSGVRFYASPITAHYNPDFVVTAYPRLGNSPILESVVGFGPAQNLISEPVVEALTGQDAPETYRDVSLNQQLSRNANQAADVIANASTRLGDSWNEGVDFNPRQVAANAITGNLARLAGAPQVRDGINDAIERGAVDEGEQTLLTRLVDAGVSRAVQAINELGVIDPDNTGSDAGIDDLTRIDFAGLPADVVDTLRQSLATLTPETIVDSLAPPAFGEALAMAQEVQALFESTRELSDLQSEVDSLSFGVSAELMTWQGLCPSDTTMFSPYYTHDRR